MLRHTKPPPPPSPHLGDIHELLELLQVCHVLVKLDLCRGHPGRRERQSRGQAQRSMLDYGAEMWQSGLLAGMAYVVKAGC
jgi:hypothetical protein